MQNDRLLQLILSFVVATVTLGAATLPAQSNKPGAKAAKAKALAAAKKGRGLRAERRLVAENQCRPDP